MSNIVTSALSEKKGFLGMARSKVRRAIFIATFALVGVAGLYFSQAATQPSVRYVIFCATDSCNYGLTTATVQDRAIGVRNWYKSKLGDDRTFRLLQTKRVTGSHTASWYRNGASVGDAGSMIDKLARESVLKEKNVKVVAILGFKGMNRCGVGYIPGPLAVVDPTNTDCATYQNSVYGHELGHLFGLNHTTDGTLMNQPAACSAKTLAYCSLNSNQRSSLLNNYSSWFPKPATASTSTSDPDVVSGDATSTEPIAPPPPVVSPVMLYKYYNESSIDNLYSTDRNDPAKPSYGYSYQGCVAQIMPTQVSGTIPVYRYYNSANNGAFGGDTLLTGTRDDAGMGNYGYGYVGLVGYIFTSQQAGTVPLKQYFAGAPKTDHFYTTEAWTSGFLDYNYEVSLGYVYPPPADKCGPTDPVPASPNKTVLHHYYNSATIDNFYTVNFNELGYGSDQYGSYKYYGCKAIVWDRQVPGSTPLWRYWNGTGGDHFYTVDRNDAGYAGYGYGIESVEGYVFRDGRVGGTGAFNRYFAGYPKTDHYYTMDAWTNGFLDYYFERTEAYTYRCG